MDWKTRCLSNMANINALRARILGGGLSQADNLAFTIHQVMENYGYNYEEITEMPIPTFQILVWAMLKQKKEQEKEAKKHRGRR